MELKVTLRKILSNHNELEKDIYQGICYDLPMINQSFILYHIGDHGQMRELTTSRVREVIEMDDNRVRFQTLNSTYELTYHKEAAVPERQPGIVLFDVDGTLSNVGHRVHHVEDGKAHWEDFFAGAINDPPNLWCVELLRAMRARGYEIHVVTARPAKLLFDTKEWLDRNVGGKFELHMVRDYDDQSDDFLAKGNWLRQFPGRARVLFVVDDRKKVVDMWRLEGLTCLQCSDWDG